MIYRLTDDIRKALCGEAYLSALSLALTLPDICGKAAYPDEGSTKRRYEDWYEEHIGKFERPPEAATRVPAPYLSGEVVYQLRCFMLHQGTPNVDPEKIKNDICKIDKFELIIENKNDFEIYGDTSSVSRSYIDSQQIKEERTYSVNVRRFCNILCATAQGYYSKNIDKFNFFKPNIIDCNKEVNHHGN